jgi:hypothetical protein
MGVKWIEHKGKKIVYLDFRDCKTEEQLLQVLSETQALFQATAGTVVTLSNYEGVSVTAGFLNRLKELGKRAVQTQRIERMAVLGITEIKSVLVQGYLNATGQKNMRTFNSESEALDWLAE